MNTVRLPQWKINSLTPSQRSAIEYDTDGTWTVVGETEKAYKVQINTKYGNIRTWCPKSQAMEVNLLEEYADVTSDEFIAKENAKFEKTMGKMNKGLEYNQQLKDLIKENGGKNYGKRRVTTAKLIECLHELNVTVPSRA